VSDLKVTQIRSGAHGKPKTRGTLRALGLGRIGKTNTLPDRPEIRGMLARVPHLVRVEDAAERPDASSSGSAPVRPEAATAAASAEQPEES